MLGALDVLVTTLPQVSLRNLKRGTTRPQPGQALKKTRHLPVWSCSLSIWVCSKCGKGARGSKATMSGKACGGADRLLPEVHIAHKTFCGAQSGCSRLIFCIRCGMYSEARIANLKSICDPTRINVTRQGNLVKGLHPAGGHPFSSVPRVHATVKVPASGVELPSSV